MTIQLFVTLGASYYTIVKMSTFVQLFFGFFIQGIVQRFPKNRLPKNCKYRFLLFILMKNLSLLLHKKMLFKKVKMFNVYY